MNKERMSIVIAALDSYGEIRSLLYCLEKQTIRKRLEILVVCSTLDQLKPPNFLLHNSGDIKIIEGGENILLNEARALGIRESRSPYVAILEDHCFPEPDWAYHILSRLTEGWTGVGAAIALANPQTILAQAAILIGYGQWHPPLKSGEAEYIPGHNSAFVRDVLLERENRLEIDMVASSLMQAELRKKGHRLYIEGKALMRHWDCSTWSGMLKIFIPVGQSLAAIRSMNWKPLKRILYGFATPLIATVRWYRSWVSYFRIHKIHSYSFFAPLFAIFIGLTWSFGEFLGFWFGFRDSFVKVSNNERNRPRYLKNGEWPNQ
jgi:hypothetical protein